MNQNAKDSLERFRNSGGFAQSECSEDTLIDLLTLAAQCTVDHPEDDETVLTPEWMSDAGFGEDLGMTYSRRYELCSGVRIMFTAVEGGWRASLWVGGQDCHEKENPTRGDVRRLCAALGIEVKESA